MTTQIIQRGAFIVFEGCDKAGKTTQCKMLVENLCKLGKMAQFLQYPDRTTAIGKVIDNYLTEKDNLPDETVHLLFAANRWEKQYKMKKLLLENTTLVVDRYSFSGIAYSAAKPGMNFEWCCNPEIGLIKPDLVFFLQIPIGTAKERCGFGDERYENYEFQNNVTKNYSKLKNETWVVLDASKSIEELQKIIMNHSVKTMEKVSKTEIEILKYFTE